MTFRCSIVPIIELALLAMIAAVSCTVGVEDDPDAEPTGQATVALDDDYDGGSDPCFIPSPGRGTEIWIQVAATSGGDGTRASPYGAPGGNIDSIMSDRTRSPGGSPTIVYLKPGQYFTAGTLELGVGEVPEGGWRLPSGWTLRGDHPNNTSLEIDPALPRGLNGIYVVRGSSPPGVKPFGQVVRCIKIDGNFLELRNRRRYRSSPGRWTDQLASFIVRVHGVHLFGDGSKLDNVWFTDFGVKPLGDPAHPQEAFVAMVSGAEQGALAGAGTGFSGISITGCRYTEADDGLGRGLITVFTVGGSHVFLSSSSPGCDGASGYWAPQFLSGAVMRDNLVQLARVSPRTVERPTVNGFACFAVDGATVEGNTTVNASHGYYSDSWEQRNVTVRRNSFLRAHRGIDLFTSPFAGQHLTGITIEDNTITLVPTATSPGGGVMGIGVHRSMWSGDDRVCYPPADRAGPDGITPPHAVGACSGCTDGTRCVANVTIRRNSIRFDYPSSSCPSELNDDGYDYDSASPVPFVSHFEHALGIVAWEVAERLVISSNVLDSRFDACSGSCSDATGKWAHLGVADTLPDTANTYVSGNLCGPTACPPPFSYYTSTVPFRANGDGCAGRAGIR